MIAMPVIRARFDIGLVGSSIETTVDSDENHAMTNMKCIWQENSVYINQIYGD